MKPDTQTARLVRFLREHPGASSLEITFALDLVNVTGRVSDARAEGIRIECRKRPDKRQGYWLVEGELTLPWSESEMRYAHGDR